MNQHLIHLLIPLIIIIALYTRRILRAKNMTISTTKIAVISAVMIYLIALRIMLIPTHPVLIIISALVPLTLVGAWAYQLGQKTTVTRHPSKANSYLLPTKQSRMFIIALMPYALTVVIVSAIDPLLMTQLKFILISTAVKSASFGFLLGFGLATLVRGRHLAASETTS